MKFVSLILVASGPGFLLGLAIGLWWGRLAERIGKAVATKIGRLFDPVTNPAKGEPGK